MEINFISIEDELPNIGEMVLTCDKKYLDDGFAWECRIDSSIDVEWSESYSVSHFARMDIKAI